MFFRKLTTFLLIVAMVLAIPSLVGCNNTSSGQTSSNQSKTDTEDGAEGGDVNDGMSTDNTSSGQTSSNQNKTDTEDGAEGGDVNNGMSTDNTNTLSREELIKKTKISPTVYRVDEIVNADKTVAGSFEAWRGEIVKNGINNDDPTENALIHSPFHKLSVNGVEVPVYTARCTTGAHSFAWVDITNKGDFMLDVDLSLSVDIAKSVLLPESRGGNLAVTNNSVTADISETGSFTFTFSADAKAKVTSPTLAPLTLMVQRAEDFSVPPNYAVREIKPGYHENNALEFKNEMTVYRFKAGFHEISSIGLPSNSVLLIDQGAYLQVTDRKNANGTMNTTTAIHADGVSNVKIISRGLLDCGKLQGGANKFKHVINTACSNTVQINGLTVINSNTWTICAYGANNVVIEKNLLLSYRTYSDGIMMSECIGGIGRYNFVRTGDDAIEFKGTGWWDGGSKIGAGCVYKYNDLWTDKGAGYCLTWESTRPMYNMMFRNNSVGFAQAAWTDRNTAIDCLLGTNPNVTWSDVTFENIEIYHVISPNAINLQVQGEGANLANIKFKNITVKSANEKVYAFRMHFSAKGGYIDDILLENVRFCGKKLTEKDTSNANLFCNQAKDYFKNLTVK